MTAVITNINVEMGKRKYKQYKYKFITSDKESSLFVCLFVCLSVC